MLHRTALADIAPQPWRNGGGSTRELLRWPLQQGGGSDAEWVLRVSVAEIGQDGPFSPFPGVERWFAVLQGAGVRLTLPQGEETLAAGDAPLHFAGEHAPACHLQAGPTRDLNLMCRRGSGEAVMQRAGAGSRIAGTTAWRAIYAHQAVHIGTEAGTLALDAATLSWSDEAEAGEWRWLDGGLAYWMTWAAGSR